MPDLAGLPDFQALTSAGSVAMFAPFVRGSYAVLPRQLAIAQDPDGNPKFQLEVIKRIGDFSACGQYAVLDFALAGDFPLDDALAVARAADVTAVVESVAVHSGFARLYPSNNSVVPAPDLLAPIPLGWTGPDYARWTMRLSMAAGELLKGALSSSSLLLGARVEFDVAGVAPRVPVTVEFAPSELLASLLTNQSNRQMATSDLLSVFSGSLQDYPLKIVGTPAGDFAEAMTERLIAAYGSLTPSPSVLDPPYIAFQDPSQLESGTVRWDLNEPAAAYRQWVLMLDPLESARILAAGKGSDSLVRNLVIPPVQIGYCTVEITANLPANRIGVPAIGVNIQVAANPPLRPSSINQGVTFTEPDDEGSVQFHLSPAEPLSYTVTGFAVLSVGGMVQEYESPSRTCTEPWVRLTTDDFPVSFVHLTAADRLLKLAEVHGTLTYVVNGQPVEQPFSLSAQVPDVAVAFPKTATDAAISMTAFPNDGGPPLTLPAAMPGRICLDVSSFHEYGPHALTVQCQFDSDTGILAIDLLPEEKADTDATTSLTLVPAQPSQTWGYVTSSPFRSGYRYRKSAENSDPPNPWSSIISPFVPLSLNGDGTRSTTA